MTRQAIIERAEALFKARGIQGTSLADVAGAAGISKGTLFYHFKSKDELILEIAFGHIQKVSDEILSVISAGGVSGGLNALLKRFLEAVLAASLRNSLHLYLIEESMSRNGKLKGILGAKYGEWLGTMTSALEPFLGRRAAALAPILLALTDGLIIQASLGLEIPPLEPMLAALLPPG